MSFSLSVLLFLVVWIRPLQQAVETEVVTACPEDLPACVSMSLHASPLNEILVGRSPEDSAGWTDFRLKVRGRLNGGPSQLITLTVRGYTAGMECSVFGQAKTAVLGFSEKQEPIILTAAGPFVVEDRKLVVGCRGCAVLLRRDTYDTVAVLTSPAWDAWVIGYNWAALRAYDDAGNLYFDTGNACIQIRPREHIRAVAADRCTEMIELGSYRRPVAGLDLKSGEQLYELAGARYVLFLNRGGCT